MRPPIGKALADDALEQLVGALAIGDRAGVVTEVEFAGVAAKVRFADMVIHADDAALEDREEVFDGVRVPPALLGILLAAVDNGLMLPIALARLDVRQGLIRHQR